MSPRVRFGIAAAVVVLAVAGLIGFSLSGATDYYRTPAELLAGSYKANQTIRVAGVVDKGSIVHNGAETSFSITDNHVSVPVKTDAVLPDTFAAGVTVVAEGAMGVGSTAGTFNASDVLAKCPSKFSTKVASGTSSGTS
ncbi:MAG TPA: cytochrome c maturation protein CcmE [Actinomycetota bacterium]|nr:cytochrome c maturation protein CcmE [Actinomycetota bacterium]